MPAVRRMRKSSTTRQLLGGFIDGQVAEWLKAHAWKVCIRETVSRVRIPPCPPFLFPRDEAQPRPLEKNNNRGFEMRTGSTTRPTGRGETKRSGVNLTSSATDFARAWRGLAKSSVRRSSKIEGWTGGVASVARLISAAALRVDGLVLLCIKKCQKRPWDNSGTVQNK